MAAVGVLGGTFDPVHLGHLAEAVAARDSLSLDLVLLVPARPWQKAAVADEADRLVMTELASADAAGLDVSRVDLDREGPTYTVDTMRDLREQFGAGTSFHFILGADALAGVPTWHRAEQLASLTRFAVLNRPGVDVAIPEVLHGAVDVVDMQPIDISSTQVRRRVSAGESIDGLVPEAVAAYIRDRGLYRADA